MENDFFISSIGKYAKGVIISLFALLIFFITPFSSQASVVELEEERVIGHRMENESDYSPGSATIVDAKELIGSAQDLPSMLERVPGLRITKLRGRGQYSVASVRGSSASQVAVYIDGQLANLGGDSAVNLAAIPAENIERIEVYRGYIPARFAVAGLGGVINIVTRTIGEKPTTQIGFGFGSYEERKANFSWMGQLAGGDFFFGSEYEGYKGDFSYRNDNATPNNPNDDYTADRYNNGFERGGALMKWQRNGWAARAEWQSNYQKLPLSAPGNDKPEEHPGADMKNEQTDLQISKRGRIGNFDMGISLAWLRQKKDFNDPNQTLGYAKWNKYKTQRWVIDYDASVTVGERHYLEFFANHTNESLNINPNDTNFSSNRTNLVLQDTIALDEMGTFLISPVIRWNQADGESATTWNIAVSKQMGEQWSLRGSYGKYVRIPNLYERYGDGGILRATPNLQWERGDQWDLGVVWNGKIGAGNSKLGLTYFKRSSKDLIEFVMFGPYTAAYRNIGKASAQGIEAEASWAHRGWYIEAAATYTDSENETDDYRNGKRLPNSPEWSVYAKLNRDFSDKISAFIDARYVSKNYLDYAQYIYYDQLFTIGLGAKWKFSDTGTLFFNVNDLFNRTADSQFIHSITDRHELAWYPGEGRTFNISARFEF